MHTTSTCCVGLCMERKQKLWGRKRIESKENCYEKGADVGKLSQVNNEEPEQFCELAMNSNSEVLTVSLSRAIFNIGIS